MALAEADPPDLLVVDIGLPDADGRDVCQAIRSRGVDSPVLFLTARDQMVDRLAGFSAGGDDYLTKPFEFAELIARLRALHRRSAGADPVVEAGDLRLDPAVHAVSSGEKTVPLTPTEFRLLGALVGAARRDGAAAGADRHRLARRRDRPRQHPRRLPGAAAEEARRAADRGEDRHRARRRLPAAMSRFSLRTRLTILVAVAAAITLAALTVGLQPAAALELDADANRVLQARASAALEGVSVRNGRSRSRRAPTARRPTPRSGSTAAARPSSARRPRLGAAARRLARRRARRPAPRIRTPIVRLLAVPVTQGGTRVGPSSPPSRSSPMSTRPRGALTASLIYAGAAFLLVVIGDPAGRHPGAAAGGRDDRRGGRVERARPGPPLQRRRALRRADQPRRDLRRHARPPGLGLRHEQLLSAELSHELRTPLAAIVTEAELALRRERGDVSTGRPCARSLPAPRRCRGPSRR